MKKLDIKLSLIVLSFVFCGCSENSNNVNGNVKVIPVDFDKSEEVSMADIFSHIEVIELEGGLDSYIKLMSSMYVKNDNYYLRDGQSVLVFDSKGHFKYSTAKRYGRAGNEYFAMNGYYIEKDGDVSVMNWNGKILRYDSLLNLKESFQVPLKGVGYYGNIYPVSDDILLLSTTDSNSDTTNWNFYSIPKHKIVGSERIQGLRDNGIYYGSIGQPYISNDNMVLYRPNNNGYSLYRVNPDNYSIKEAYRYDLGKDMLDQSEVGESVAISTYLNNRPDYKILMDMEMNNKYLVSMMGYHSSLLDDKKKMHICFYSLEDDSIRLISRLFCNRKTLKSILYMDDTAIYSFVNGIKNLQYYYEDSLLDEDSRQRLKRVNDDTNAFIFKYYLRDDIL